MRLKLRFSVWVIAAALAVTRLAGAVIMRHDVSEDRFLKLAESFPASVSVRPEDAAKGCPGDSGGAAYFEHEGKLFVAGVGSWQDTHPTNRHEGLYGVIEYYLSVPYFRDWIESTIKAP